MQNVDLTYRRPRAARGFTFIEVLVAMLIFVLAVLAAVNIAQGSVRATRESKEVSIATWLLQSKMVELETNLESQGIDKACDKEKKGKFEAPYQDYNWVTTCNEIDFRLSESAAQLQKAQSKDDSADSNSTKEDVLLKMILQTAGDYITKSLREIHTEVLWMSGKTKRKVDLTTHFVRYDQPLTLGAGGGLTGGTSSSGGAGGSPGGGSGGGGTPH